MPGITTDADTSGGALTASQSTVYANGNLVIVHEDVVAGHGDSPHILQNIIAGIKYVNFISLKFFSISIFLIFSRIIDSLEIFNIFSLLNSLKELLRATKYLNSLLISILVIISFPML